MPQNDPTTSPSTPSRALFDPDDCLPVWVLHGAYGDGSGLGMCLGVFLNETKLRFAKRAARRAGFKHINCEMFFSNERMFAPGPPPRHILDDDEEEDFRGGA